MDWLKGWGSYAGGVALILFGIAGYVSKRLTAEEATAAVIAGFTAIRLRRAIGNGADAEDGA